MLIVEFAAQLATLGLKRGLAQQLAHTDKPHVCVVWRRAAGRCDRIGVCDDASWRSSRRRCSRNSEITRARMAAAGHRHRARLVGHHASPRWPIATTSRSTVRARAIVEPWTISIAAFAWSFISTRDGLIIAYALSMVGALIASIIPFLKSYGLPRGWSPDPATLWRMARRNMPVAAADAVEWGSRRVDIAVLGLFFSPAIVGIYYVAQHVASLPPS